MPILRRTFLKTTGNILALSGVLPAVGYFSRSSQGSQKMETYVLKGFEDEQEEYPALVSDLTGEMWIFSLRRLKYPNTNELISVFNFDGKSWIESDPVTKNEGQYEAPVAACAKHGKPVVAWCSIEADRWSINAATPDQEKNWTTHQFSIQSGKAINPILHAPVAHRTWIAWENYSHGKFSIFISRYTRGQWSDPIEIKKNKASCFDPALAEDQNGNLFVTYGWTDSYHQNIELLIIDSQSLQIKKTVPVAVGGGFENRVNLNTKSALAIDSRNRLWISYESNRNASRLEDADNYTGDRCCAILSYQNGKIVEPVNNKWLFNGKNDHKPTFFYGPKGELYLATHCGGDFAGNPFWKYRISCLDVEKGWSTPETILESKQKGVLIPPALTIYKEELWLATLGEQIFDHRNLAENDHIVRSRLTQLMIYRLPKPQAAKGKDKLEFKETKVESFHNKETFIPERSGRQRLLGGQINNNGEEYLLVYGNLHEHSENSSCWPAGTEGTLHDEYRFGLYSEGYHFMGITDHGYTMNEVYWRKSNRLADFYNDPPYFVAIPAMEWTLSAQGDLESVFGAGHYNIVFASSDEALKFVRNGHEIFNVNTPESTNPILLWQLLDDKQIDCITIPHHPASAFHPLDWNVHDPDYVPVVEIFQCRGNAEYPGCPRDIQLKRHRPSESKRAFIDYALREKNYKMGFIASGDHNNMGVGAAALWVKEFSRKGLLEAMRNRRCFATTGDKIIVDFRLNGALQGSTLETSDLPVLNIKIRAQGPLDSVEVLRNSKVLKTFKVKEGASEFTRIFTDEEFEAERDVLYYYIRATQKNNEIAWSSPIWVEAKS